MTRDERREKLESFGRAPALLSAALKQFPKKMWLFKTSPEKWSIHEVILHLADSEATAYICCRRLIAEPGLPVLTLRSGALGRDARLLPPEHQGSVGNHPAPPADDPPVVESVAGLGVVSQRRGSARPESEPGAVPGDSRAAYSPPHRTDESELRRMARAASTSQAGYPIAAARGNVQRGAANHGQARRVDVDEPLKDLQANFNLGRRLDRHVSEFPPERRLPEPSLANA
jgi:hypothetical protein